jgi:hypothetical protein
MQPQHPLESHATWGGTYRQNMKMLATIKRSHPDCEARRRSGLGHHGVSHTRAHARAHFGADRVGPNQLLCSADVVGNRAVAFQHPDWRGGFDLDLDQGAKTRRAFLDRCASEKVMISTYSRSPELAMSFAPAQRSAGFQAIGAGRA